MSADEETVVRGEEEEYVVREREGEKSIFTIVGRTNIGTRVPEQSWSTQHRNIGCFCCETETNSTVEMDPFSNLYNRV